MRTFGLSRNPETPNPRTRMSETTRNNGVPTQVWFVQGKKKNKEFRSALALHREQATLSENKENIPPGKDDVEEDPQPDEPEKEGHDVELHKHH